MSKSLEVKENSKKRKFVENSKLFTEFKGLNSLNNEDKGTEKIPKLDVKEEKSDEVNKIVRPPRKTYMLLENIDASVSKESLQKYLSENGVDFSKICLVPGPLAITYFNREKDVDRLFNICQGLHYKSNELFIVKSSGKSVGADCGSTSNMSDVSVHIKNLESTTTEDEIRALLSDPDKAQNIIINSEKRTAIIDFGDSQTARECIAKLDNCKFGEKTLSASFLVKSQRPDQFTVKVTNLPHGFNKLEIREAFPTTSKIKVIKGLSRYCLLHFRSAEDVEAVLTCTEAVFVKGVPVKVEEVTKGSKGAAKQEPRANYVLNIYNMPFDSTLRDIKEQYPAVRFVEMLKNSDGMFVGSAKLNFAEKEACEEALKNTKGLTWKHRKIRAEMKVENGGSGAGAMKEVTELPQETMDFDE